VVRAKPAHGVPRQAQLEPDGTDAAPLDEHLVDGGVPLPGPDRGAVIAYRPGWNGRRHPGQDTPGRGHLCCCGDRVQAAAVPSHGPLNSLAEVVPRMPTICDLDASGAPRLPPSNGTAAGPVPPVHLSTWPGGQPGRERVRRAFRQNAGRPAGLDVDQQRSVRMTRRSANSSTPSARGALVTAGSGSPRNSRISVILFTSAANLLASRAPDHHRRA
jgi:hypothetical protein